MKEKEIKVLKVKPHEHPEVYMLKNTLEVMQEAVGGYIDIVWLDDDVCILLNDEGKLIGLEGNRRIGAIFNIGNKSDGIMNTNRKIYVKYVFARIKI